VKKKIAFILCIAMAFFVLTPTANVQAYRAVSVYINGRPLQTQDEARIINDTTYVPLRAICELFGADDIVWTEKTRTATIYARGTEMYITQGNTYIVANGRYFASDEPVKNIGGRLYLPVRLIAAAFASSVEWDGASYTVNIKDIGGVPLSGDVYYDKDEVYWLSRIIYAESGAEPFRGQIAVGNVVLNRVESKQFPNSVYGVIFDKKYGVQFSPVASGTIYKTPSASAIAAAKICLEGYSVNRDVLYFMNPDIATNNWISNNRRFAFKIGQHSFYY